MIDHAIATSEEFLTAALRKSLASRWSPWALELRRFLREVAHRTDSFERKAFVVRRFLTGSRAARGYLKSRLTGEVPWPESTPETERRPETEEPS